MSKIVDQNARTKIGSLERRVKDVEGTVGTPDAETLEGENGAFYRDRGNHTGEQAQSTVTNLVDDLAAKAPIASPTFTGTVGGVTKAMVGLGNADNTSDANKPVSTAQQTALDAKLSNQTGIAKLSTTTVNTNTGTKQNLYTVPVGFKCVVTRVQLRDASTSLAAMADDTAFGFNVDSNNLFSMTAPYVTQLTAPNMVVDDAALSIGTAVPMGAAGENLGVKFLDTSITATLVIDVFGYLVAV